MNKLSVVIPYHSNNHGLAVTLIQLQSQLIPPDQIIVIDTSLDQSGLAIAKRYAAPGTKIIVEVAKLSVYAAWNKGIELAKGGDVLIINDDLIIPQNLVQVFNVARANIRAWVFVPKAPPGNHFKPYIDTVFHWYADMPLRPTSAEWMPGCCFLLTEECIQTVGLFDEKFIIWWGDTDYERRVVEQGSKIKHSNPIVCLDNLYVYHYGGTSYEYKSAAVKKQTRKDGRFFIIKWFFRDLRAWRVKQMVSDVYLSWLGKYIIDSLHPLFHFTSTKDETAGKPLFSPQCEEEDVLTLGSAEEFASSIKAVGAIVTSEQLAASASGDQRERRPVGGESDRA